MDSAKQYHLERWNVYHNIVKDYNQLLSGRFSGIFSLLTSAWVIITAFGTQNTDSNSGQSVITLATTLAPILLTLLLMHEMRIFIQFQQDNYFMIYHAYKLCSDCEENEFQHLLDITQGSGVSIATFIFMALSNLVVILVPIINLIQIFSYNSDGNNSTAYFFVILVNIACLTLYIGGAIGTFFQYLILCQKVLPDLWYFAIENKLKLTGAKWHRATILTKSMKCRFLKMILGYGREGTGKAWKTTKQLFGSKRKLFRYVRRFNRGQKKSLLACVYDSWYNSSKRIPNTLPYTVFIDITTQCNLKCSGCYSNDLTRKCDMDFDKLSKVIPVLKAGGVKAIVLTGGEPTLYEQLMNLVTQNRDVLFFIFTNGQKQLRIYDEFIRKLGNIIFIFSVDGDKDRHEGRRGSGTYQPILENMRYLKKLRIGFGVSVTVNRTNIYRLPYSIEEIGKYKPAFTLFFRFNSNNKSLSVTDGEYEIFCKKVKELPDSLLIHLPYYEAQSEKEGCVAGKYIFHIRNDFKISNCPYVRQATDQSIIGMTVQEIADLLATQTACCACPAKAPQQEGSVNE